MCGRYTAKRNPARIADQFEAVDHLGADRPEPDYNVAPTKTVPVIRAERAKPERIDSAPVVSREIVPMRWGLIPSWAKDPKFGARTFNARVETLATAPAFRTAYRKRRCIVPADGWYEWRKSEHSAAKQPFYMTRTDGLAVSFAGLWEIWQHGDQRFRSFTIITTDAQGQLADVHTRMPFLLRAADYESWLDTTAEQPEEIEKILLSPDLELAESLELRPVSAAVGKVANNSPALLERRDPDDGVLF